jgi:hypothetical protein
MRATLPSCSQPPKSYLPGILSSLEGLRAISEPLSPLRAIDP